jgi:hypothetical protein
MIQNLRQDILIEWNLYDADQQRAILEDFRSKFSGDYTISRFLGFLKDKAEIEKVIGGNKAAWGEDASDGKRQSFCHRHPVKPQCAVR